ncbi:TlpA family protein disulfide reductase [Parapedobacter sp. 2B3]|uniref:TlpA family protein disulfide reductase n=1 Tax=Parapedobacter sp. 2B3 TaxID=3342381 RepID=UPI0035B64D8E
MVRLIWIMLLLAGGTPVCFGQLTAHRVQLGQKVPDYVVSNILNNGVPNVGNVNLNNDQLLILDFWDTACAACIKAMPKMEALQNQFAGSVRVLAVTHESRSKIEKFWKANSFLSKIRIPTVVEDSVLSRLFPYVARPHLVWIRNGIFVAQTNGDYATGEYIEEVLRGGRLDWAMKNEIPDFDYSQPLVFARTHAGDTPDFKEYDVLLGHQSGVRGHLGIYRDTVSGTIRGVVLNMPIAHVYFQLLRKSMGWDAFSSLKRPATFITPNQLMDCDDIPYHHLFYDRQVDRNKPEWDRDNEISFETMFVDSGQTDSAVYRRMLSELDRRLGFGIRFERKRIKCLVLRDYADGGYGGTQFDMCGVGDTAAFSGPITNLIYELNQCRLVPPVFNESDRLSGQSNVELVLAPDSDIASINRQLERYKVQFVLAEREVDMMVVVKPTS